jgi:glyceraldehyde 3-phosphate dehydrogenase
MSVGIAINGFGRIGRNIVRQLFTNKQSKQIKVVAINDLTDPLTLAHLLKYDSVHGRFPGTVEAGDGFITVNGQQIKVLAERDPAKLPWGALGASIVLECTGLFTQKDKAKLHMQGGAKKVLISAPAPDPDITLAYGVNHSAYRPTEHHIISNASCTTNCLAPVAKVLVENFGIVRGSMTTIHSYTNDQQILDLPHKDLRRARAAGMSMIPTTTGAAKAVGLVIPELVGKVDGFAIRVPTPDVSVVDFVAELGQDVTTEELNRALQSASENALKGILGFSTEPLVSIDYVGDTHSAIVDSLSTMVVQKRLAKVVAWYDNEMGFSARMCDVAELIACDVLRTRAPLKDSGAHTHAGLGYSANGKPERYYCGASWLFDCCWRTERALGILWGLYRRDLATLSTRDRSYLLATWTLGAPYLLWRNIGAGSRTRRGSPGS